MDYKDIYVNWETNYALHSPSPKEKFNYRLIILLGIIAIGSAVLSGGRTGDVISDIATFKNFATKILPGIDSHIFIAFEAILGFLTFELSIFAAGYLLQTYHAKSGNPEELKQKQIYWFNLLLWAAVVPVALANLYPGLSAFVVAISSETAKGILEGILSAIVGLSTTPIVFVSGKVLALTIDLEKGRHSEELAEWQASKKRAWYASKDYKQAKQLEPVVTKDQDLESKIVGYLTEHEFKTMSELAKEFSLEGAELLQLIQRSKRLQRNGLNVTLLGG